MDMRGAWRRSCSAAAWRGVTRLSKISHVAGHICWFQSCTRPDTRNGNRTTREAAVREARTAQKVNMLVCCGITNCELVAGVWRGSAATSATALSIATTQQDPHPCSLHTSTSTSTNICSAFCHEAYIPLVVTTGHCRHFRTIPDHSL